MFELKPCRYCGKVPKVSPLVTRTILKQIPNNSTSNIFKMQTERIEVPVFYTIRCQNNKCKNHLHKFPNKMISEDSVNGAILKWNQQN